MGRIYLQAKPRIAPVPTDESLAADIVKAHLPRQQAVGMMQKEIVSTNAHHGCTGRDSSEGRTDKAAPRPQMPSHAENASDQAECPPVGTPT
jgi:hypothetical protein